MIESGCTHQGDEVLSPPTTNVRARFVSLHSGDIQIVFKDASELYPGYYVVPTTIHVCPIGHMCVRIAAGATLTVISEYSGQSGGETPVPIPNTEVKPVYVLHCTMMCEL